GAATGSGRLVDKFAPVGRHAQVAAERRLLVERLLQLLLGGEWQVGEVFESDKGAAHARLPPLPGIEGRGFTQAAVLTVPCGPAQSLHFVDGRRFDLALPDPVLFALVIGEPAWTHCHFEAQINLATECDSCPRPL